MKNEISLKEQFLFDTLYVLKKGMHWLRLKTSDIENRFLRSQYADEQLIDLNLDEHADIIRKKVKPVFVLSTGRAGTKTLFALVQLSPYIDSYHEPDPNMFNLAYVALVAEDKIGPGFWENIFRADRDRLIYQSEYNGKTYFESNNRMTFFAHYLAEYYPLSKFIFLYRHPFKVIRSFMRRGYYQNHPVDYSRVIPLEDDPYYNQWVEMNLLEKCAWNWNKVNTTIMNFFEGLPAERKFQIKAEYLFSGDLNLISEIFGFIRNARKPSTKRIKKVIEKKINKQRIGSFPSPEKWTEQQVDSVMKIVNPAMRTLGYERI